MTQPLVLHYDTSGILAVLKTERCPGQKTGFGGIGHGTCGCDHDRIRHTIAHVNVLQPGEETWCLEQCLLARRAEQTLTGQDV